MLSRAKNYYYWPKHVAVPKDEPSELLQQVAPFYGLAVFPVAYEVTNSVKALNKAIVDSGLRPQSCCHLTNCIEMQEIVDCKLDANNE